MLLFRHLPHIAILLLPLLPSVVTQQIGSFFTVVYLNGAALSPSQISCSDMGQPSYCCASGQSCAWDNAGQLACCAQGMTCTGTAAAAGQYQQPAVQTKTVYNTWHNDCGCEETTTAKVNVAPAVVPVTKTVQQHAIPTVTTTTTPVAAAVATPANANCPGGYTTVTEANVGQPTRVVGCYVIINRGARWTTGGKSSISLLALAILLGLAI